MARPSKMWFRKDRNAWFATINSKRHNLGKDKETAKTKFHQLMAKVDVPVSADSITAAEVMDKFLIWCKENRAKKTFEWYEEFLQSFLDSLPDQAITVERLRPYHVNEWIATKQWNNSTIRGGMRAVQRAFNWATKHGYIDKSPIKYLEKPSETRRETYPTEAEYLAMVGIATEPFKSFLSFLFETGCRPKEARILESRHIDGDKIVYLIEESKGKKTKRVIYLNDKAKQLVAGKTGCIFNNKNGKPWTVYAINCRMRRIAKKTGKQFCAYSIRHLTATRWLEAGLDHVTVAKLLGHKDSSMVSRVYSHIGEKNDYLSEQLKKVSEKRNRKKQI